VTNSRAVSLSTLNGNFVITCYPRGSASPNNLIQIAPHSIANFPKVRVPFSLITFIIAGLGLLPWFSYRFSLRTLLIGITLIAVGLVVIGYSLR
jgi:hypothetical protein